VPTALLLQGWDQGKNICLYIFICTLFMYRGDVHTALKLLLQGVGPDSPNYIKARVAAANIHLTHRHDKKVYIRYFQELVERNPESIATYCMLADAYTLRSPLQDY
jgi:hypothetical protein